MPPSTELSDNHTKVISSVADWMFNIHTHPQEYLILREKMLEVTSVLKSRLGQNDKTISKNLNPISPKSLEMCHNI